jgi:hypothetical protein
MAAIHSFVERRVSRAKSCTCDTSRSSRYFVLGSGHLEFIMCTFSVMFSIVRSLRGGMSTCDGSMIGDLTLMPFLDSRRYETCDFLLADHQVFVSLNMAVLMLVGYGKSTPMGPWGTCSEYVSTRTRP